MARFPWSQAVVIDATELGGSGKHLTFEIPDWKGALAGQHIDVRLGGAEGKIVRSYSLSSGPSDKPQISIERVEGGIVSTYLVDEVKVGDLLEVRGPIGSKFVYNEESSKTPTVLIGGGSGIAPLRGMWRAAKEYDSEAKLMYSVRTNELAWFTDEIGPSGIAAITKITRGENATGRITKQDILEFVADVASHRYYLCGPNAFVDFIDETLIELGVHTEAIQKEKWG